MTFGSLFTGIGGLDLGLERAGMECRWQVEIEAKCRRILRKHWPTMKRYKDIRTVTRLAPVDLICGGFPCQDISSAGKGAGLEGARSGLWWEMYRIICLVRPSYVLVENVPPLRVRGADVICAALEAEGYACTPLVVGARHVGAPHRRDRVWLIAHTDRAELREQSRRRRRSDGTATALAGVDGAARYLADTKRLTGLTRRARDSKEEPRRRHVGRSSLSENELADADSRRRSIVREQEPTGIEGTSRCEPDGRGSYRQLDDAAHRDWWRVEPSVGRVVDGVPARVDRLTMLGNAVVPANAEILGRALLRVDALRRL